MDFTEQSCKEFIKVLASKEPVPGGGGASALAGAVGMALGSMVGSLTVGKKKYANVQQDIISLNAKAESLQEELLSLVAKDAEVFEPLSVAYGMPKDTAEQQAEKDRVMEAALVSACEVPLEIMRKCCEAIDLHSEFAKKGTAIAISDVGVGVIICKSALLGASLNVYINTKIMQNREHAEKCDNEAQQMLEKYMPYADDIYKSVLARLR